MSRLLSSLLKKGPRAETEFANYPEDPYLRDVKSMPSAIASDTTESASNDCLASTSTDEQHSALSDIPVPEKATLVPVRSNEHDLPRPEESPLFAVLNPTASFHTRSEPKSPSNRIFTNEELHRLREHAMAPADQRFQGCLDTLGIGKAPKDTSPPTQRLNEHTIEGSVVDLVSQPPATVESVLCQAGVPQSVDLSGLQGNRALGQTDGPKRTAIMALQGGSTLGQTDESVNLSAVQDDPNGRFDMMGTDHNDHEVGLAAQTASLDVDSPEGKRDRVVHKQTGAPLPASLDLETADTGNGSNESSVEHVQASLKERSHSSSSDTEGATLLDSKWAPKAGDSGPKQTIPVKSASSWVANDSPELNQVQPVNRAKRGRGHSGRSRGRERGRGQKPPSRRNGHRFDMRDDDSRSASHSRQARPSSDPYRIGHVQEYAPGAQAASDHSPETMAQGPIGGPSSFQQGPYEALPIASSSRLALGDVEKGLFSQRPWPGAHRTISGSGYIARPNGQEEAGMPESNMAPPTHRRASLIARDPFFLERELSERESAAFARWMRNPAYQDPRTSH